MDIPVYIKWKNKKIACICSCKCRKYKDCEQDIVSYDPFFYVNEVMTERKYKKVNGRYRQL